VSNVSVRRHDEAVIPDRASAAAAAECRETGERNLPFQGGKVPEEAARARLAALVVAASDC